MSSLTNLDQMTSIYIFSPFSIFLECHKKLPTSDLYPNNLSCVPTKKIQRKCSIDFLCHCVLATYIPWNSLMYKADISFASFLIYFFPYHFHLEWELEENNMDFIHQKKSCFHPPWFQIFSDQTKLVSSK